MPRLIDSFEPHRFIEFDLDELSEININNIVPYEEWIPFTLTFETDGKKLIDYKRANNPQVSFLEVKLWVERVDNFIIKIKETDYSNFDFANNTNFVVSFFSSEAYFELIFKDAYEYMVEIELWVTMGEYTDGKSTGYSKGYQFTSNIQNIQNFINSISLQLDTITKNNKNI